jgi:L1 cell adhesion molecule like protein
LGGQIAGDEKKDILDKCDEVIRWLDTNQAAEKDEFEWKFNEMENVWSSIIEKD